MNVRQAATIAALLGGMCGLLLTAMTGAVLLADALGSWAWMLLFLPLIIGGLVFVIGRGSLVTDARQQEPVNQDRGPNFRSDDGRLYLVRCYACNPDHGTENYALAVADGQCAWCGWKEQP